MERKVENEIQFMITEGPWFIEQDIKKDVHKKRKRKKRENKR